MATLMGSLLRAGYRTAAQPLNILTFPTHERYQSGLAATGHNFFLFQGEGIKTWNETYAPLPSNHSLFKPNIEPPIDIDFDLILSQNKFGQFPVAHHLSRAWHVPLISLEHTLPFKGWDKMALAELRSKQGDVNVFISEYSLKEWGGADADAVIHHGVDTNIFSPAYGNARRPLLLSVVNDWINRDWCCGFNLWQKISEGMPVCVVGDTPGLSKPATSTTQLIEFYSQSSIFLNTSLISPVPTALLEAMSCGCACVSTATCMIPEVIHHGVNGLISNDPAELRQFCQDLLKNEKLARKLGEAARQTILERFSMREFVNSWDSLFRTVADRIFVKDQ